MPPPRSPAPDLLRRDSPVGLAAGAWVGTVVGASVGAWVGSAVGSSVGCWVGSAVGSSVGCWVGSAPPMPQASAASASMARTVSSASLLRESERRTMTSYSFSSGETYRGLLILYHIHADEPYNSRRAESD